MGGEGGGTCAANLSGTKGSESFQIGCVSAATYSFMLKFRNCIQHYLGLFE